MKLRDIKQALDEYADDFDYGHKKVELEPVETGGDCSYKRYSKRMLATQNKPGDNSMRQIHVQESFDDFAVHETFKYHSKKLDYYDALNETAKDHDLDVMLVQKIVEQQRITRQTSSDVMETLNEVASMVCRNPDDRSEFAIGLHKVISGMPTSLTIDEAQVFTKAFIAMLESPQGVEIFESMKSIFEAMDKHALVTGYQEYLGEQFVDISDYIRSTGSEPSGYKTWVFKINEDIYYFSGTYAEARNNAINTARGYGDSSEVMIKLKG